MGADLWDEPEIESNSNHLQPGRHQMRHNSHPGINTWNIENWGGGGYTLLSSLPPFFKIERPRSTNLKKVENISAQTLTKHRCMWFLCFKITYVYIYTITWSFFGFFYRGNCVLWMWSGPTLSPPATWNRENNDLYLPLIWSFSSRPKPRQYCAYVSISMVTSNPNLPGGGGEVVIINEILLVAKGIYYLKH